MATQHHMHVPLIKKQINRINLLATVRILLKLLSQENPHLRIIAQRVLRDCYKQHQANSNQLPLAALIEHRLRQTVGRKYWSKAKELQLRKYPISFKSACVHKNISTFTVGSENNMMDLVIPLQQRKKF